MMMNTRKVLLASSTAIAFGLVAGSALAQVVPNANPNGGTLTPGAFNSDGAPTITNSDPVIVPGGIQYDSTAVETGTTGFTDLNNSDTVNSVTVNADVTGVYNTTQTTVTNIDTSVPSATVNPTSETNTVASLTTFDVSGSTGVPVDFVQITSDPSTISGNTVAVSQTNGSFTGGGLSFTTYEGTATYVGTNNVDVTFDPTPTSETTLNGAGLTTTGAVNATGGGNISNGTSYLAVNPDNVVIHGGTASTTVTVSNGGVQIADTTNGNTLLIDNFGQISNNGTANSGQVVVNDTLQVSNDLDVVGDAYSSNGSFHVADDMLIHAGNGGNGNLTVNGNVTLANTAGASTTIGTATSVNNIIGSNNTIGNVAGSTNVIGSSTSINTINGTTTLAGNATLTGTLNVQGNISNSTGAVTIADNLIAGNVSGTSTVGGANATQANLAAGNSYVQVNTDNVVIHGGTSSTTVTVSNGGVQINDTTNGNTLLIDNTGAISNNGGTQYGGAVRVNDTLSVRDGLEVLTGQADFRQQIVNLGNANGGAVYVNDNFTVQGNSQLVGTLSVGGLATTNGINNVTGNIANAGNYTTGTGNITTTSGQIAAGTIRINPTNNGTISGLSNGALNSTSTEAVTGQQLFATNQLLANTNRRVDKAYQGIAMGFASNAAPLNLANGEGGISGGVGYFQGEWGGAVKAQYVTDSGVGLGLNVGFSADAVGGGVGASIKF